MMRVFAAVPCLVCAALAFSACSSREPGRSGHDVVRMAGSSTVFKEIVEPALPALAKQERIVVTPDIRGTGMGFIALDRGDVDVLLASADLPEVVDAARQLGWSPPEGFDASSFQTFKIFEAEIRVITNFANKVKDLTKEQIVGIFQGTIANWKEVGGEDLPIMVVLPEKGRATRQVFQDKVMAGRPFSEKAFENQPTAQVDDVVRGNKSAIGFTSSVFAYPGRIRYIDTLKISRPLLLVTKGPMPSAVERLYNYLVGRGEKYWNEYRRNERLWLPFD
jgi:phosphate transport system substrate-binding protein